MGHSLVTVHVIILYTIYLVRRTRRCVGGGAYSKGGRLFHNSRQKGGGNSKGGANLSIYGM